MFPVTYLGSKSRFGFDRDYSYDTYELIERYPHSIEFVSDQQICDEFDLELVPIHCERWRDRKEHIAQYKRNVRSLTQGNEILSFLERNVSLSDSEMESLIIAALAKLANKIQDPYFKGHLDQVKVIQDLTESLYPYSEETCTPPVHGITDTSYPVTGEKFSIFPSKYSPLPSLSTCKQVELGYGSQSKVPTNTPLEEVQNVPSTRFSLYDNRKFGDIMGWG